VVALSETTQPFNVLVIPVEGPVERHTLEAGGDSLAFLQNLVGGWIEAVGVPSFISGSDKASAYVNEEGKLHGLVPNMRATDFMVPGVGIGWGDYIAGPLVLAGFDPETGDNAPEVPDGVERRVRLIEREAA
jgi:hypothetical protein